MARQKTEIRGFLHWMLAYIVVMASPAVSSAAEAPEGKTEKVQANAESSVDKGGGSPAELAARLVLQGESMQSPLLLLAAAEILGELPPDSLAAADVERSVEGAGSGTDTDKTPPTLDPEKLRQRAVEIASEAERSNLQRWLDGPRSRGLIYAQGKDLESVVIGGVTYKVLDSGVIKPGIQITWKDVTFEGKKPARVLVVGDGDGDLDLWVYDQNSGLLIGEDVDTDSLCVVDWTPRYEGPFRIRMSNVGGIAERYIILANW